MLVKFKSALALPHLAFRSFLSIHYSFNHPWPFSPYTTVHGRSSPFFIDHHPLPSKTSFHFSRYKYWWTVPNEKERKGKKTIEGLML